MITEGIIKKSRAKEKSYKVYDAEGLYLLVNPNDSKYWRMKYFFMGKEKCLSLGVYPSVSIAQARDKRDHAKRILANNEDPIEVQKTLKMEREALYKNTFELVARDWYKKKELNWSQKHSKNVWQILVNDVFPGIGSKPITQIQPMTVLSFLQKIENRGATVLSHRALQICGEIFRYAIASGKAVSNPTSDLKGALKTSPVTHYKHLSETELPEFIQKLNEFDGSEHVKLAIKFLMLTFVRTGELRGALWEEINFEQAEWRIPAERMKNNRFHIVHLSEECLKILNAMKEITGKSKYIFPQVNNFLKPMSENTMLYSFYRMGYHSKMTGHGFRATASTILNENGFKPDVIEKQLSHCDRNKVRASYNHAQYLSERKEMMVWWSQYLKNLGL
jgi:integrase